MNTEAYITFVYTQAPQCMLHGHWTVDHALSIEKEIEKHTKAAAKEAWTLNGAALESIDTVGALLLKTLIQKLGVKQPEQALQEYKEDHRRFIEEIWRHQIKEVSSPPKPAKGISTHIEKLGRWGIGISEEILDLLNFCGRSFIAMSQLRQLRFSALIHHMQQAGVAAIPIVCLLAFLISIVLAYQGATQLKNFGADIFTIDLTVISILREMGVLLTAIIVAGRSGSAYAAEIGVMKLREEISALKTLGLDSYHMLILPCILALVIMLPVLTFLADMAGLLGTAVITNILLDVSFHQFLSRVSDTVELHTFMVGMAKAPIFGFIISVIATYQGMQVTGTAESVGRLTTIAVVQSIFLVIFADALFSILFSQVGL